MFEIGWSEILVIGIVALVVIGPKDLPRVLRTTGQMIGRLRRMAGEFQATFSEALREAERQTEIDDLKKKLADANGTLQSLREPVVPSSSATDTLKPMDDPAPAAGDGLVPDPGAPAQATGADMPASDTVLPDTMSAESPVAESPLTTAEAGTPLPLAGAAPDLPPPAPDLPPPANETPEAAQGAEAAAPATEGQPEAGQSSTKTGASA